MKNNYEFWDYYLKELEKKIIELCNTKKELYIDLHIHSNYSADCHQTLEDIIESTNSKNFDIISITDHDSLGPMINFITI